MNKYTVEKMFLSNHDMGVKISMSIFSLYFLTPMLVFKYEGYVLVLLTELVLLKCNRGIFNFIFYKRSEWSKSLINNFYPHLKSNSNSSMFDIQKNAIKTDKFLENSGYTLKEISEQIEKEVASIGKIYLTLSISAIITLYPMAIRPAMGISSDFYCFAPDNFKIILAVLEVIFFLVLFLIPCLIFYIHTYSLKNFQRIVSDLVKEEHIRNKYKIILQY